MPDATGVPARLHRHPYVGKGADGARRSAQIDREESHTLDLADPRVAELLESAERWEAQADRLETEPLARIRMKLDLDAIEAAALAAPAGPWRLGKGYGAVVADVDTGIDGGNSPRDVEAYGGHLVGESMPLSTRRFLVAASPDVVLRLVEIARRVEETTDG